MRLTLRRAVAANLCPVKSGHTNGPERLRRLETLDTYRCTLCSWRYTVCPKKSEPLNILQQQPQICSDFNKILLTQDDICYKHYYIVSYKSVLTLLKYEFLNNITHKS